MRRDVILALLLLAGCYHPPPRAKTRLTAAQWRMLRSLASTGDAFSHLRGRSQHGGAGSTLASLWRRGFIDKNGLTAAGRDRLIQAGDIPKESP